MPRCSLLVSLRVARMALLSTDLLPRRVCGVCHCHIKFRFSVYQSSQRINFVFCPAIPFPLHSICATYFGLYTLYSAPLNRIDQQ